MLLGNDYYDLLLSKLDSIIAAVPGVEAALAGQLARGGATTLDRLDAILRKVAYLWKYGEEWPWSHPRPNCCSQPA